jgi:hypothetical protein
MLLGAGWDIGKNNVNITFNLKIPYILEMNSLDFGL